MDEWVSGDTFSDDPMEAPTQPAMQAEPAADAAEVRKVSELPLPARKVPARPLPGELAVLDSITTLHFRKVAVSASTDSLPKLHPDVVGVGDHFTSESLLAGDFLQGSKPQTTPHLQVSGVQSLLAGQSMLNGSGLDHLSLLTGGSTIPAWSTSRPPNAVLQSFNKYSKLEAKKPESFGGLPTDSAFDAARLEFKLVDQTVVKAARSDLTRPFNEACLMCQDAHMVDICSGGGGRPCSCKRCGWYCLGCMTCGATSCFLDQNCKCRNFKLGAIRCLDVACCHLPLGCNCLDLKGNCCPGGFQLRCQQMSLQCGKCLTCGTLGWCVDEQCRCRNCKLASVRCINGVCCHAPVACGCLDMKGNCCPGGWAGPCQKLGLACLSCVTCGAAACCLDQDCKCRKCKLGLEPCCHLPHCGPWFQACAAQCSACTGHCSEQGWGGAWGCYRRLELSAQDAEGKELFHLQRGFAIPVQLCYPCAHLACDPLKIVVSAPSGAVLGHVRTSGRAYSSSGWLDVFDADNRLVYSVQEKLWMWPFSSTFFPCLPNILKPEKTLRILRPGGEQVGEIVHLYPGWQKAFYTAESDWMITFPAGAESVHKALLIGACQLSKFFFFPGHVCGTGLGYFC